MIVQRHELRNLLLKKTERDELNQLATGQAPEQPITSSDSTFVGAEQYVRSSTDRADYAVTTKLPNQEPIVGGFCQDPRCRASTIKKRKRMNMHRQIRGLKDQLGLVNYQLGEVTKLDAEAPQAGSNAAFPDIMSATVVGKSLGKARELLTEARTLLTTEIDFYEGIDKRLAEHQTIADETAKTAAVEATNKEAAAREAITAGTAAYCMQAVAAASVFMLKGMEKARSYRS